MIEPLAVEFEDPSPYAPLWPLDSRIDFLNHGSFGASPRAILAEQEALRQRMEGEPVRFFAREAPDLLDDSRNGLADLIGGDAEDVVFVRNATGAVNSVLQSLALAPEDEILVTDHAYNACRNAADWTAKRTGATVVTAILPMPIESPSQIVEAILSAVTEKTRLVMLDHITSPTAVILPVEQIVAALDRRDVDTLIDGAHAPGMIQLDVDRIGAAYYTGNCHKWLCAPKGAGFLHVRRDRQNALHPAVISHGYNVARPGRSHLHDLFDWTGTDDPTPWLCVGPAIRFLEALFDGGLRALMARNHRLAVLARDLLCEGLGGMPLCPESMLGAMAAVRLPDEAEAVAMDVSTSPTPTHPIQTALLQRHQIEVPFFHWPAPPRRIVRISAQAYNGLAQYERLVERLRTLVR